MRKIGTVGVDHARGLADAACNSIKIAKGGVLLTAEGTMRHFAHHQELADVFVQRGDCYIVGPHGEVSPFIAQAMACGAIPTDGNRVMHVDAHYDHRSSSPNAFGGNYNASETTAQMWSFLEAGSEEERLLAFRTLIDSTLGDIETFLAALAPFSEIFAAFLREELQERGAIIGPMLPESYIDTFFHPRQASVNLGNVIRNLKPTIYSMDADILGAFGECLGNTGAEAKIIMLRTIREIFDGMKAELDVRQNMETTEGVIYTISVDPAWCVYPERFVQEFIDRFYLQLVRINTARRAENVVSA